MAEIQRNAQTQLQVAGIASDDVQQLNGSVGVAPATEIAFALPTETIEIYNTHATQTLRVYFKRKGGAYNTAYRTLRPYDSYSITARQTAIKLEGSGAGTTYEIVAVLE